MKKLIFLILLGSFVYSIVFAQNMAFTFTPKDANNIIDSIRAINLATGQSVLVKGTNEISFTSTSANINVIPNVISIYPNPSLGQSEMQFYSKQNEDIKIILINAAGQIVASEKQQLTQGFHKFKITIRLGGIYIVQVIGIKNKFSQKIITTGNNHTKNNIQYIGLTSTNTQKSAIIDESDVIHFLIYSGDNITKITDSFTESKTYDVQFIECKDKDGKNYSIVQIGEQWWMAENLAYLPKVSFSEEGSYTEPYHYVYDYNGTNRSDAKSTENYKIYGVLYNWFAARISCPDDWHLPSDSEWKQLEIAINMSQNEADEIGWRYGSGAVNKLKATIGWDNDIQGNNGNGTDIYGFTALPGGYSYHNVNAFDTEGIQGKWWSASGNSETHAWSRLFSTGISIFRYYDFKIYGQSVRCVWDTDAPKATVSTSNVTNISYNHAIGGGTVTEDGGLQVISRGVCWNSIGYPTTEDNKTVNGSGVGSFTSSITGLTPYTTYYVRAYATNSYRTAYGQQIQFSTTENDSIGTFTDFRDMKIYQTITIGNQTWMAENLAYEIPGKQITDSAAWSNNTDYDGWSYYNNDKDSLGNLYGVLYQLEAAKAACPEGWHLPGDDEWKTLEKHLGMSSSEADAEYWRGTDEGNKIKESGTEKWNLPNSGASNSSGFTALPGGGRGGYGSFHNLGNSAFWWSSSDLSIYAAWSRIVNSDNSKIYRNAFYNANGLSIRCIKN